MNNDDFNIHNYLSPIFGTQGKSDYEIMIIGGDVELEQLKEDFKKLIKKLTQSLGEI